MKIILTVLMISTVACQLVLSQTPRKEFDIELPTNELAIKPGETKQIDVNLVRSKGYHKAKATLGLSSSLPEGITITFEPKEGIIQSSRATIIIDSQVKQGAYLLLLKCTMNNKMKGTMLKLVVIENETDTSKLE
jgi:hypothetical protein